MFIKIVFALYLSIFFNSTFANDLFFGNLKLQKITSNAYAIVGPMNNRTAVNAGNNATFGFVVTKQGVVLIDSGGSYNGAKNIHNVIKSVTAQPITYVINSGGQDHRWLGNGYFKKLGAKIIASSKAVKDQKARVQDQFFMLDNLVGVDGMKETEAVYADTVFENTMKLTVGNTKFELFNTATAHTPGDSFIWMPEQSIIFAGDIVFTERLLGVADHSSSKGWIQSFNAIAAFKPKHIVPGHGSPTTLDKASADTLDYLVFLRHAVMDFMDDDGDIADISKVDQSSFSHLISFDVLAGRNAQRVYSELEWE